MKVLVFTAVVIASLILCFAIAFSELPEGGLAMFGNFVLDLLKGVENQIVSTLLGSTLFVTATQNQSQTAPVPVGYSLADDMSVQVEPILELPTGVDLADEPQTLHHDRLISCFDLGYTDGCWEESLYEFQLSFGNQDEVAAYHCGVEFGAEDRESVSSSKVNGSTPEKMAVEADALIAEVSALLGGDGLLEPFGDGSLELSAAEVEEIIDSVETVAIELGMADQVTELKRNYALDAFEGSDDDSGEAKDELTVANELLELTWRFERTKAGSKKHTDLALFCCQSGFLAVEFSELIKASGLSKSDVYAKVDCSATGLVPTLDGYEFKSVHMDAVEAFKSLMS